MKKQTKLSQNQSNQSWAQELGEIFREEIAEMGETLEYYLDYFPTRESWVEISRVNALLAKNRENFELIRAQFEDDNLFDDFLIQVRGNTKLLDNFLNNEDKKIFIECLNQNLPRSSGAKKLINYFHSLTKNEVFNNEVLFIREKYNIPLGGAPFNKSDYDKVVNLEYDFDETIDLCKKYGFYSYQWLTIFRTFIFFNDAYFKLRPYLLLDFNLCKVVDEKESHGLKTQENTGFADKEEFEDYLEFCMDLRKREDEEFPIAIRVSPYASERDILEFIKRNLNSISFLQNRYKAQSKGFKIGKLKKKRSKIQKRNDFIYENRYFPRKEIMRRLSETFGVQDVIDVGYIGKIISLEKKRRKEV